MSVESGEGATAGRMPGGRHAGHLDGLAIRPTVAKQSVLFIVGASLFAIGSAPALQGLLGTVGANIVFFAGSWFFTSAAFMQLLLSGPAILENVRSRVAISALWLAAAVQFLGTILFNVSTGNALNFNAVEAERLFVWAPNAEGSAAFLISSVFAVLVLYRHRILWNPRSADWHGTWLNMAGSIAFGVSAVGSIINPSGAAADPTLASMGTFIGALCFCAAATVSLVADRRHARLTEDSLGSQ